MFIQKWALKNTTQLVTLKQHRITIRHKFMVYIKIHLISLLDIYCFFLLMLIDYNLNFICCWKWCHVLKRSKRIIKINHCLASTQSFSQLYKHDTTALPIYLLQTHDIVTVSMAAILLWMTIFSAFFIQKKRITDVTLFLDHTFRIFAILN